MITRKQARRLCEQQPVEFRRARGSNAETVREASKHLLEIAQVAIEERRVTPASDRHAEPRAVPPRRMETRQRLQDARIRAPAGAARRSR